MKSLSSSSSKHFAWYWLPVIVWAVLIFILSSRHSLPGPHDYWTNFSIKKVLHVIEFGILAVLVFRAGFASSRGHQVSLWLSVVASLLYAASDEFHQSFVPGREATVRDFLIDAVGVLIVALWVVRNEKALRGWAGLD